MLLYRPVYFLWYTYGQTRFTRHNPIGWFFAKQYFIDWLRIPIYIICYSESTESPGGVQLTFFTLMLQPVTRLCLRISYYVTWYDQRHTKRQPNGVCIFNTLRPRQNGRHFPDYIFKCIFLNENVWISINISLKFVPKGLINNIPALV